MAQRIFFICLFAFALCPLFIMLGSVSFANEISEEETKFCKILKTVLNDGSSGFKKYRGKLKEEDEDSSSWIGLETFGGVNNCSVTVWKEMEYPYNYYCHTGNSDSDGAKIIGWYMFMLKATANCLKTSEGRWVTREYNRETKKSIKANREFHDLVNDRRIVIKLNERKKNDAANTFRTSIDIMLSK